MTVIYEKDGKEVERFEEMPTQQQVYELQANYDNVTIKSIQIEFIEGTLVKETTDLGDIDAKIVKSIKVTL